MKLFPHPTPAVASLAIRTFGQVTSSLEHGLYRVGAGVERHPWPLIAVSAVIALASSGAVLLKRRRTPSADELERLRREQLAHHGRIVAGILLDDLDAMVEHAPSTTLFYRYRISGVEYSCAQDLSALPIPVERLRLDLPVQIRYDARNPGNSIVAAEGWNGLCL